MSSSTAQLGEVASVSDQSSAVQRAQDHLKNVKNCLGEIETLQARLLERDSTAASMNGLPTFLRDLQNDQNTLERIIATSDYSKDWTECTINISRALQKWSILKRCHAFVALNQGFQGSSREDRKREMVRQGVASGDKQKMHRVMKEQGRVEVDVVDYGREWIITKSLSRDRLARQMTDCGWGWGEYKRGDVVDRDEWEDIALVKTISRVVAAARRNRCEYEIPRVRVILSNIARGEEEFDVLLEQIEKIDPLTKVIIDDMNSPFLSSTPPDCEAAIKNLLGDEHHGLTPVLNMDHTILIDLISDLTHAKLEPQPWQARTTSSQIKEENSHEGGLMTKALYPLLRGRKLVCTVEAAEHFHEVLKTVGTETEVRRGKLIVPFDDTTSGLSIEDIRNEFQSLSIHPLPSDIQLPITIDPQRWEQSNIASAVEAGRLPQVALDVTRTCDWKNSKLSIFMYGWASGYMTLTSNREIKGQIKTMIEEHRTGDERGPGVWKVPVTRNLLAKGAAPRKKQENEDEQQDGP